MTEAFPLQWPSGRPRNPYPRKSRFKATSWDATKLVLAEIRRLGGINIVISTNVELRNDGLPYANRKAPLDRGVAVYFQYKSKPMCFACDKWDTVGDNIYAIAKTIEALRGIERWGTGEMVQQAFNGFVALPSNSPWQTLGLKPGASRDEIESAYRERAKTAHPDAGGNHDEMARLNAARAELLRGAA